MRSLTIIGRDLNQLVGLAAALRNRFHTVTILHCDDIFERAARICVGSAEAILARLDSGDDGAAIASRLPGAAFIVAPGAERERLLSAGALCFDPDCPPGAIVAALAPRVRGVGSLQPDRAILGRSRRARLARSLVRRRA